MKFDITKPDQALLEDIVHKINNKTKPIGALGQLEKVAQKICLIQQTLTPELNQQTIVVFAGDHGLAEEGVSAYPQEVTHQMVLNFLAGGAAINVFSAQHDIDLKIVYSGVNFDFDDHPMLIRAKTGTGTKNSLHTAAMTREQLTLALKDGAQIVEDIHQNGSNIIGFGEMGIGNTSAASLIMSHICKIPIELCVGHGTGLDDEGWRKKVNTLLQVQHKHADLAHTEDLLQAVGGFEMAMMTGAMLQAASLGMIIMVDGFIATSAYLCAQSMNDAICHYVLFCHCSDESGHRQMLEYLDVHPMLNMSMRLGEGTGCALAYPLVKSSVDFINKMASFDSAGVSTKS